MKAYSLSHMSRAKRGNCSPSARQRGQRGQVKRQAMLDYIASCDYAPSLREIGKAVGLSSSSTVWGHVRTLREEGRLAPNTGKQRCIALTDPGPSEVETLRERVAELEAAIRWAVEESCNIGPGTWQRLKAALGEARP